MKTFPVWAYTTGFPNFAECQLHSAKDRLHSAKYLPSVTLGKRHSAKNPTAMRTLPSVVSRALGKGFAECPGTRQISHVAPPLVRRFAECLMTDTRQSFAECPSPTLGKVPAPGVPPCGRFAECWILALGKVPASGCGHVAILPSAGTRQTFKSLPSASTLALGKVAALLTWAGPFAECFGLNTLQSGEFFFFCFYFLCFSIQIRQKYI